MSNLVTRNRDNVHIFGTSRLQSPSAGILRSKEAYLSSIDSQIKIISRFLLLSLNTNEPSRSLA